MFFAETAGMLAEFSEYREGDKIRLQPSNVKMKPIIVPAADVEIQGRVIGVLRKY